MARIVLTYAEPRVREIAGRLHAAGHDVVSLPFSNLSMLPEGAAALAALDLEACWRIIAASPSTVDFAVRARPAGWPSRARFAVVGPGTRDALLATGLAAQPEQIDVPGGERHDADALLEMPGLQAGEGRRILVLAGASGRRDWGRRLEERGFDVTRIVLYRQEPMEPGTTDWQALQAWAREGRRAAFIVTTVAAADRLLAGLRARDLASWAGAQPAVCPHARIVQRLAAAGWGGARVPDARQWLVDAAIESGLAKDGFS